MTTVNYLADAEDVPYVNAFEAVPCTLVFDADGELVQTIDTGVTYPKDVVPLVTQLVEQAQQSKKSVAR